MHFLSQPAEILDIAFGMEMRQAIPKAGLETVQRVQFLTSQPVQDAIVVPPSRARFRLNEAD